MSPVTRNNVSARFGERASVATEHAVERLLERLVAACLRSGQLLVIERGVALMLSSHHSPPL